MHTSSPTPIAVFLLTSLLLGCDRDPPGDVTPAVAAHIANEKAIEFYRQTRFRDAIAKMDIAIGLDPTKSKYYFNRATAKGSNNDFEGAIIDYNKAIELDPTNPRYFGSRGYDWYKLAQFDKAIADQKRVIRMAPWDSNPYYNLARIYATCQDERYRDGSKAVAAAERACELTNWEHPILLDTLAAAYAETGDFEQAMKWQQKAIDQAPPFMVEQFQSHLQLYRSGEPLRVDSRTKHFQ